VRVGPVQLRQGAKVLAGETQRSYRSFLLEVEAGAVKTTWQGLTAVLAAVVLEVGGVATGYLGKVTTAVMGCCKLVLPQPEVEVVALGKRDKMLMPAVDSGVTAFHLASTEHLPLGPEAVAAGTGHLLRLQGGLAAAVMVLAACLLRKMQQTGLVLVVAVEITRT
jgi:hypothetical protein